MSVSSVRCGSLLSAAFAVLLVGAAGCGTDAKGVDDCREIEQARCAAAQSCGVSDVPACQRFYRDQCLHGLAVASPGSVKVKACVATIRAAGLCATQVSAGDAPASGCSTVEDACAIVNNPETSTECAFLMPNADAGTAGSGGAGSGGETAAAGNGGSAGADDLAGAGGS
jgi:hypothetical protein